MDGASLGCIDGFEDGLSEGPDEGPSEGPSNGWNEGLSVGFELSSTDGALVGVAELELSSSMIPTTAFPSLPRKLSFCSVVTFVVVDA